MGYFKIQLSAYEKYKRGRAERGCLGIFLCYPAILVRRIRNEEQVLKKELPGYEQYCEKVRWRLIPGIW